MKKLVSLFALVFMTMATVQAVSIFDQADFKRTMNIELGKEEILNQKEAELKKELAVVQREKALLLDRIQHRVGLRMNVELDQEFYQSQQIDMTDYYQRFGGFKAFQDKVNTKIAQFRTNYERLNSGEKNMLKKQSIPTVMTREGLIEKYNIRTTTSGIRTQRPNKSGQYDYQNAPRSRYRLMR